MTKYKILHIPTGTFIAFWRCATLFQQPIYFETKVAAQIRLTYLIIEAAEPVSETEFEIVEI